MFRIVKSDKNIGFEFDKYENCPGSDITGECWVIVEEYNEGDPDPVGCFGYCNDSDCKCSGSQVYY